MDFVLRYRMSEGSDFERSRMQIHKITLGRVVLFYQIISAFSKNIEVIGSEHDLPRITTLHQSDACLSETVPGRDN